MRQWLLGLVLLTLCICRAGEGECSLRVEARTTTGGKLATGVEQIGLTANGGKGTLTVDGTAKTGDEPLALDTTAFSDGWHEFALTEDSTTETRNLLVLNGANVAIHGGMLEADETWSADKIHIIRNWVRVPEGITLTIGDNAILKFCDATGIQVDGTLETGTGIVLTSIIDDSIGGDTDMDGGISTESVNYQLTGNVTQYTYALTVSGGTGSGRYLPEAKIMITATRDDGEPFHSWKVMGMTLSDEQKKSNPLVITMPEQDVSIEAVYGYAVTVENGSGSGVYTTGSTVSVEADAAPEGKAFQKWIAEDIELTDKQKTTANMSFTMPDNDVKLKSHYGYAVTVTGGSGAGVFDAGDTVTVQATVPAGKTFYSWSATGVELTDEQKRSNPLTFIMPANSVALNGVFGYQLNVTGGSGSDVVVTGNEVTITATVPAGKSFHSWNVTGMALSDEQKRSNPLTITMPEQDVSIEAVYGYVVTVENGSGSGVYTTGSIVSVEADAPPEGKAFQKWIAEGVELTESQKTTVNMSFTMPGNDVKLMPHYGYAVAVTGGSGAGVFDAGDTVAVQATVPAGKAFHSWSATGVELTDGQKRSNPLTFTMPANAVVLNGVFGYQLNVTGGSGSDVVLTGGEVTITAKVPAGKSFYSWNATGMTLSDEQKRSNPLTITMPEQDVSIEAVYGYAVTVENGSGSGVYTTGSAVSVQADAAPEGKAFQKWIAEGVELTDKQKSSTKISFTMPDNDVKLTA